MTPVMLAALAAIGWGGALVFLILWRRAAVEAATCPGLRDQLTDARGRLGDADDRQQADATELRRLGSVESALLQKVEGLEGRLTDAADERTRLAREAGEERAVIAAKLDDARGEIGDLRVENERLRRDLTARAERHDSDVALLKGLRDEMTTRFKSIADDTMRLHGDNFTKVNDEKLRALLDPMRQHIGRFQDELRQTHEGAAKDRERLKTEIEMLTRRSEQVSQEAVALTRALKGEKQRQGAWGEMILERVLEDSGLRNGHEYHTQVSVNDGEGGRRRPDAVVKLPGARAVVIDAKVSLVAYEAAVNAEDGEARAQQLRAHVLAVKKHIDDLAARDYGQLVDGSVDYTLMFMPVEGALAAALEQDGSLTSYAIAKKVGIATPTTLMVAMRTIQHVWEVERRETNAEKIAERAGLMFDKMAGVLESFQKVGAHLESARASHDEALDRLSRGNGNLCRQFDDMRRLGARVKKDALPVDFDGKGDEADIEAAPTLLAEPAE